MPDKIAHFRLAVGSLPVFDVVHRENLVVVDSDAVIQGERFFSALY